MTMIKEKLITGFSSCMETVGFLFREKKRMLCQAEWFLWSHIYSKIHHLAFYSLIYMDKHHSETGPQNTCHC